MRISTSAVVATALLATAGTAQAGTFVGTDFVEGPENQTIVVDGVNVNLNSDPRGVAYQGDGSLGIGVFGGGGDSQIGSVDEFNFTFDEPVFVHKLAIGELFALGERGDIVDEAVRITTDNGSWVVRASDIADGTILTNQDFGGDLKRKGGGVWVLEGQELFGGPITFMKLDPVDEGILPVYSDFTFRAMNITPVPAPGTAALAGIGGLMCLRRRRAA